MTDDGYIFDEVTGLRYPPDYFEKQRAQMAKAAAAARRERPVKLRAAGLSLLRGAEVERANVLVCEHQRESNDPHKPRLEELPIEAWADQHVVLVEYGYIGSAGFLVERHTELTMQMGSHVDDLTHLWAYRRGINWWNQDGNDLELFGLKNEASLRFLLRDYFTSNKMDRELLPPLRKGGRIVVPNLNLSLQMNRLLGAEKSESFGFRVLPPSAEPR